LGTVAAVYFTALVQTANWIKGLTTWERDTGRKGERGRGKEEELRRK